ncbi:MAG: hypothetical protein RIF36_15725 [Imperialibacter sp.]|uniref:hypothetical protein n=1 Tax=Imperialibacter sp. TaxID=2038411 RepID=UPI0032EF4FDD
MNFPRSTDDVAKEITICCEKTENIGELRIRQLINILEKVPDEYVLGGILKILENDHPYFPYQKYCGMILADVNPKPSAQISTIINQVITNWDKSLHQLPTWLKINFGKDAVNEELDILIELQENSTSIDKLRTMKWWLEQENLF